MIEGRRAFLYGTCEKKLEQDNRDQMLPVCQTFNLGSSSRVNEPAFSLASSNGCDRDKSSLSMNTWQSLALSRRSRVSPKACFRRAIDCLAHQDSHQLASTKEASFHSTFRDSE